MLFNNEGKPAKLSNKPTDKQRAAVREVHVIPSIKLAPKGMFSLQTRAKLKV